MEQAQLTLEQLEAETPAADLGLFTELALSAGAEPPTEFRIFKAGENRTRKGCFLFEADDAKAVMAKAKEFGADYSVDFGHSMFSFISAGDPAEQNKAAGWFRAELRGGELWATDVTWTPLATQKLKDREYRYTSPTFNRSEDGHINELLNVALTGIPATNGLKPLVASANPPAPPLPPGESMDPKLLALLGLASSATLTEVLAAIDALKAKALAAGSAETTFLSLTGKTTLAEALGTAMAWKAAAETAEKLATRVQELEGATKKAEVKALLEAAVKDGKVAPAQVALLTTMGEASPEQLKAFIAAAPAILPKTNALEVAGADGVTQLTAEDMKVAQLMNTDLKKLAALRLERRGIVAVGELTPPAPDA